MLHVMLWTSPVAVAGLCKDDALEFHANPYAADGRG